MSSPLPELNAGAEHCLLSLWQLLVFLRSSDHFRGVRLMRQGCLRICAVLIILLAAGLGGFSLRPTRAESKYMFLTVTDYEAGISYRQAQWHAPIGQLINPCSYADHFVATIDWNDGSGEHKPDTNVQTRMLQTIPVVQSGIYLFWDDEHVAKQTGTQIVTTKISFHCSGEPAGDREYTERNAVNVYARIPVNQVEFTKNGKSISSVKGHDNVDLTITLDAPAPPSGTWVKLEVTPAGNLNSLPPYVQIAGGETQETIGNFELRKPDADLGITVTASTVGRAQESQKLTVTP